MVKTDKNRPSITKIDETKPKNIIKIDQKLRETTKPDLAKKDLKIIRSTINKEQNRD